MRTEFIRTALKVAQTGSMAKAADAMFMSQTTVRWEMMTLEKDLGFALFERTRNKTNPITLTDQGAKWLAFARKAMELLDQGAVEIKRAERLKGRRKTM